MAPLSYAVFVILKPRTSHYYPHHPPALTSSSHLSRRQKTHLLIRSGSDCGLIAIKFWLHALAIFILNFIPHWYPTSVNQLVPDGTKDSHTIQHMQRCCERSKTDSNRPFNFVALVKSKKQPDFLLNKIRLIEVLRRQVQFAYLYFREILNCLSICSLCPDFHSSLFAVMYDRFLLVVFILIVV